ncbi:histone H1-delta-like [Penaeus chinensis]|uniref:histone H1-delta-like n=1 Tax=Penaeus chinensis TaxID=139456 RepID=UPI001FB7458B|nr:histone H1-delta-like [Penaeus chinensis]XP_047495814.1 histone H1-delta-like [Penaeus chinensis]
MSSTSAKRPSAKRAHPKYSEMVGAALRALKERNGSSRQAILRFILASFQVGDERVAGVHLKQALRRGVVGGSLQQTKGTGASGSFKLSKEELKKAVPRKDSAKKPSAKTATKKPNAKTATKKPSAKTATKKPSAKTASKKPSAKTATKKPSAKTTTKKVPTKNGATKKPTTKKAISKKQTVKKTATKKQTTKNGGS